jgi:mannosyltransferase OCH1-like enzyme
MPFSKRSSLAVRQRPICCALQGAAQLYQSLKTPVERSDLWRYAVMCNHGGIYADADTLCIRPVQVRMHADADNARAPRHCLQLSIPVVARSLMARLQDGETLADL